MNNPFKTTRRNFIKNAGIGSALALTIPEIILSSFTAEKVKKVSLNKDDIILFQGDSITDWGRNKTSKDANTSAMLGSGYPLFTSGEILKAHPSLNLKFYNKGISGNKVYQLADRWDTDCLDLKPNVLSILVGVNDYWHMAKHNYKGTIETYRNDYKALLERTKKALPDVQLIIGEPFAVSGVKAVDETWFPAFDAYREAAHQIADSFGAAFIPYQSIFDKAQKLAPGSYWTIDGVHPSVAGSQLMAEAWMAAVKA